MQAIDVYLDQITREDSLARFEKTRENFENVRRRVVWGKIPKKDLPVLADCLDNLTALLTQDEVLQNEVLHEEIKDYLNGFLDYVGRYRDSNKLHQTQTY